MTIVLFSNSNYHLNSLYALHAGPLLWSPRMKKYIAKDQGISFIIVWPILTRLFNYLVIIKMDAEYFLYQNFLKVGSAVSHSLVFSVLSTVWPIEELINVE